MKNLKILIASLAVILLLTPKAFAPSVGGGNLGGPITTIGLERVSSKTVTATSTIFFGDIPLNLDVPPQDDYIIKYDLASEIFQYEADAGGAGSPGGNDTEVQFNDGGAFNGDTGLTWDKTNNILTIVGVASQKPLYLKNALATDSFYVFEEADSDVYLAMKDKGDVARVLLDTEGNTYFTADNNFGIGTSSPSEKLDVVGGTINAVGITSTNVTTNTIMMGYGYATGSLGAIFVSGTTVSGATVLGNTISGNTITGATVISVNQKYRQPYLHIAQGTFDLASQWDLDSDLWLWDLATQKYPYGIEIVKWTIDCTVADPTTELDANLMYCDAVGGGAFPGASATLIDVLDTTTGNSNESDMSNSDLGSGEIPTNKSLYIDLDADPVDANTMWHIRIHFYILDA